MTIPIWLAGILATAALAVFGAAVRWTIALDKKVDIIAQSLADEKRLLWTLAEQQGAEINKLRDRVHDLANTVAGLAAIEGER